jgi:hypothetical protein
MMFICVMLHNTCSPFSFSSFRLGTIAKMTTDRQVDRCDSFFLICPTFRSTGVRLTRWLSIVVCRLFVTFF